MVIRRDLEFSNTIQSMIGKLNEVLDAPIQATTNYLNRATSKLAGMNHIHFGKGVENYLTVPIIPSE